MVAKFIGCVLQLLPEAPSVFKKMEQLFELLAVFARVGDYESMFLVRCGVIPRLVDFYSKDSKVPAVCLSVDGYEPEPINRKRMTRADDPNWAGLLGVIDVLLERGLNPIPIRNGEEDGQKVDASEVQWRLDYGIANNGEARQEEWEVVWALPLRDVHLVSDLAGTRFMGKILADGRYGKVVQSIVQRLAWQDIKFSQRVAFCAGKIMKDLKHTEFERNSLWVLVGMYFMSDSGNRQQRQWMCLEALLAGVAANTVYESELKEIWAALEYCTMGGEEGMMGEKVIEKRAVERLLVLPNEENLEDGRSYAKRYVFMNLHDLLGSLIFNDEHVVKDSSQKRFVHFFQSIAVWAGTQVDFVESVGAKQPLEIGGRGGAQAGAVQTESLFDSSSEEEGDATSIVEQEGMAEGRTKKDEWEQLWADEVSSVRQQSGELGNFLLFKLLVGMFERARKLLHDPEAGKSAHANDMNWQHGKTYTNNVNISAWPELMRGAIQGLEAEKKYLLAEHGGVHQRLCDLYFNLDRMARNKERAYIDSTRGGFMGLYCRLLEVHPEMR